MCCQHLNRRQFLGATTGLLAGASLSSSILSDEPVASKWASNSWDSGRPFSVTSKPLSVQPALMYRLPKRREKTSWKSWGGIQTEEAVAEEMKRIAGELDAVKTRAKFPMKLLPVVKVTSEDDAARVKQAEADVTVVYPATGGSNVLFGCFPEQGGIIFVRHRSGPVYYWYEALSEKYLRTDLEGPGLSVSVRDVVVDDLDELMWRLRALYAVRNFLGARVVALGGPAGKYAEEAPAVAREKYRFDIVDVSYDEVGKRIRRIRSDANCVALGEKWAREYLSLPRTKLMTERSFVVNAFLLYGLFKDLMQEHEASIFTIHGCMSTIIPMAETTACLTLSLLNDEGLPAFCESDFVIIPPAVLLFYVTGRPVFLHNSTFPHRAVVTCAHCTSPRRMNGKRYEPAEIMTHYESEYGAAPKVSFPKGQEVTFINPEYATGRWVGIKGAIESNPFYEICRSQQDVRILGNWKKLLNEVRDSHWVMAYGDHLKEIGYAASRIGITWDNVSEA